MPNLVTMLSLKESVAKSWKYGTYIFQLLTGKTLAPRHTFLSKDWHVWGPIFSWVCKKFSVNYAYLQKSAWLFNHGGVFLFERKIQKIVDNARRCQKGPLWEHRDFLTYYLLLQSLYCSCWWDFHTECTSRRFFIFNHYSYTTKQRGPWGSVFNTFIYTSNGNGNDNENVAKQKV